MSAWHLLESPTFRLTGPAPTAPTPLMLLADLAIAVIVLVSMGFGFVRGFFKESISIASLLIAVWAALNFGANFGALFADSLGSEELQLWLGSLLVLVTVLAIGGLIGWGVSKVVRMSALRGSDRSLGLVFGFARGVILVGLVVLGGQYAGFSNDAWWRQSRLIPYGETVAEWIRVMAPKGVELLQPDEFEDVPIDFADSLDTGS